MNLFCFLIFLYLGAKQVAFVLKRTSYAEIRRGHTSTHSAPPERVTRPYLPQEVIRPGTKRFANSPAQSNAYIVPYERHQRKQEPNDVIDHDHYYRSLSGHLAPTPVNVGQLADIINAATSILEKFNVRAMISLRGHVNLCGCHARNSIPSRPLRDL